MRRLALAVYVLALVAVVVFGVIPFMTTKRDFPASITQPYPLFSVALVIVPPHQRACMSEIAVDPHAQQARFRVGSYGKPGPPLQLTLRTPGYSSSSNVRAGWADNALLQVPVRTPKHSELVNACIRNGGKSKIALYASDDRTMSRSHTSVKGKAQPANPDFGFWEATPHTFAQRLTATTDRISVFRGPLGYAWVVWVLLALFFVGLPVALGAALWIAARARHPSTGSRSRASSLVS